MVNILQAIALMGGRRQAFGNGPGLRRLGALIVGALFLSAVLVPGPASAQFGWPPSKEERRDRPQDAGPPRWHDPAAAAPARPPAAQPYAAPGSVPDPRGAVERSALPPVMSGGRSGLPYELWRGVTVNAFEAHIAKLKLPLRSDALQRLWRRILLSDTPPPGGAKARERFLALRVEALYRSGLVHAGADLLSKARGEARSPIISLLDARTAIAMGERERGCGVVKSANLVRQRLTKVLRHKAILIAAYCAASGSNRASARLAAEIVREEGIRDRLAISVLDAMARGRRPKLRRVKRVTLLGYRFLELAAAADALKLVEKADGALLSVLARDEDGDPRVRLSASEAAVRALAIKPGHLADAYRAQGISPADLADPLSAQVDPALKRAILFRAIEAARDPQRQARLMSALMQQARSAGLYLPTARLLGAAMERMPQRPQLAWFAETGVEISLANAAYGRARSWAILGSSANGGLLHWLALADIADPATGAHRGTSLVQLQDLAQTGRLSPQLLHRLATVLDALRYNVPIPLWEAASRTPQPKGGHLPATGVLSELQAAAKAKHPGRTVLLAMRALGASGAEGAHMIALGDTIRALTAAGLEADARQLGLEALFVAWPRRARY